MKTIYLSIGLSLLLTGCITTHKEDTDADTSTPPPPLYTNKAPKAQDDTGKTYSDKSLCIDVTANDSDLEGELDKSSITMTKETAQGQTLILESGQICYKPDVSFSGEVQFAYKIKDMQGEVSNEAIVTITVSKAKRANTIQHDKEISKEWFIQLVAEDKRRGLKAYNTQLGQMLNQTYQLKALPPRSNHLTIRFNDQYKSDFHIYNSEDSWNFSVNSDDTDATILLKWRGLYKMYPHLDKEGRATYTSFHSINHPLFTQMKLIDTKSGIEIPAQIKGESQHYLFNMEGEKQRYFKWVLQREKVDVMQLRETSKRKIYKSPQKTTPYKQVENQALFDITKPPEIIE